ncbi:hypothetical protein LCM00_15615 [Bacillus infantis]|uniref:hypothetical protein n=1 Tax=Bacillus infantis TaxID=324767 RepID=UPI001CD71483|nr:hypothetical protein [Bacillus infantis]MCA1040943.1 hypothetical protein [Bacillus infantis]
MKKILLAGTMALGIIALGSSLFNGYSEQAGLPSEHSLIKSSGVQGSGNVTIFGLPSEH